MFVIEDNILKRYIPSERGEKTVIIPDGVRVIGGEMLESDRKVWRAYTDDDPLFYQAFRGSEDVENVFIPSSVVEIGTKSFQHCPNIRRVHIPRGVRHICEFFNSHLEAVLYDGTREEFAELAKPGWCMSCKVVHCIDGDLTGEAALPFGIPEWEMD